MSSKRNTGRQLTRQSSKSSTVNAGMWMTLYLQPATWATVLLIVWDNYDKVRYHLDSIKQSRLGSFWSVTACAILNLCLLIHVWVHHINVGTFLRLSTSLLKQQSCSFLEFFMPGLSLQCKFKYEFNALVTGVLLKTLNLFIYGIPTTPRP